MNPIGKAHGDSVAKQELFSSGGFGSTASPSLFAASSSSNQTSFALAATGPSAFPPPLFGAASSSNISNPANFGFAVTGPPASPSTLFGAASSSNIISKPVNFGFAVTGASACPSPLFGAASSSNIISNPASFGLAPIGASTSAPPFFDAASSGNISNPANFEFAERSSLFAFSSSGNSSTQALSSSTMTSLPKRAPPTNNATTVASPPVFGCGFIVNSSSDSSRVAPPSTPFPAPLAPSFSIFGTTTTPTVLPPGGEEVGKPTPCFCPSCGQTLLSGTVYTSTLTFDQSQLECFQSISAMPENQAKSHEELRWANHLLQGNAKNNVVPVAQSNTWSQPQQWTIPVMVLPVMPLPTWSTLPYTPASASTLPAIATNAASFGYAPSPSFSVTPTMPGVFNLCDMFRRL